MEWLLFTYWLPPEPSRKRVFVWRQLKKLGALSLEGGGWLIPKTEPLAARMTGILQTVTEMEGTANLFTVIHFSEAQEKRILARFYLEREQEYAEIGKECHKTLHHIEREAQQGQFNLGEVEELEGDLAKINRWFSDVKERDFQSAEVRKEVEKLIGEVEARLATFTQQTYERLQGSEGMGFK